MRSLTLCYHLVSPESQHRLSLSPELLVRQVRALSRFRRVRVTFDDAFRSAATVFPALRDLDIPICIFVCTGFARTGAALAIPELEGDDPQEVATMTWDELRAHAADGVAVGSHSVMHSHLPRLADEDLRRDLVDSKAEIEAELGRSCLDIAYPYGEHDLRVRAAVRAAGYVRGFALWERKRDSDAYALPRLDLYRRHTSARALLMATPFHRLVA